MVPTLLKCPWRRDVFDSGRPRVCEARFRILKAAIASHALDHPHRKAQRTRAGQCAAVRGSARQCAAGESDALWALMSMKGPGHQWRSVTHTFGDAQQ